jgi:hypothetical protein
LINASLVEVHATHVFDAVAACHAEWAEGFSAPLQLRANILADVLLHLVILCVYLHRPLQNDLQIYFLARDFTMEELAHIAADDPYALAKKGQVFRHLTIPETVFQVPETSYRMQNIPPKWYKIKTLVRKAATAHIPPRFSLPTAYDLHGEEYVWKAAELQSISGPRGSPTRGSSPLSGPPSSLMEVEPVEESNVEMQPTKKRGIKWPREDDPEDEIGLWAPSRPIVLLRDEALGPAHRDKARCPGVQYDLIGCIIHGIKVARTLQMVHQCFFDSFWM